MPDTTDTTLPEVKQYRDFTYRRVEYRPAVGYIYAQYKGGTLVGFEVFRAKYTPCRSRSRPDGTT
ncbi:MAG: hypothetical protein R3362_04790, partial [Rhodothermales bacterium]|nr:hypothetical protein [Rhodothermales bacterium]